VTYIEIDAQKAVLFKLNQEAAIAAPAVFSLSVWCFTGLGGIIAENRAYKRAADYPYRVSAARLSGLMTCEETT
jgi:hypothetical protein